MTEKDTELQPITYAILESDKPFYGFLQELRESGCAVSTSEWIDFLQLCTALQPTDTDALWLLAQSTLAKNRRAQNDLLPVFLKHFGLLGQNENESQRIDRIEESKRETLPVLHCSLPELVRKQLSQSRAIQLFNCAEPLLPVFCLSYDEDHEFIEAYGLPKEESRKSHHWNQTPIRLRYEGKVNLTQEILIPVPYGYIVSAHKSSIRPPFEIEIIEYEPTAFFVKVFDTSSKHEREDVVDVQFEIGLVKICEGNILNLGYEMSMKWSKGIETVTPDLLEPLYSIVLESDVDQKVEQIVNLMNNRYKGPVGETAEDWNRAGLQLYLDLVSKYGVVPDIGSLSYESRLDPISASNLCVALLRCLHIPARLAVGYRMHSKQEGAGVQLGGSNFSGWVEYWDRDTWKTVQLEFDYPGSVVTADAAVHPEQSPDQPVQPEQKEKEDIEEVVDAGAQTSEDTHGGSEATKDIADSPNSADEGQQSKEQPQLASAGTKSEETDATGSSSNQGTVKEKTHILDRYREIKKAEVAQQGVLTQEQFHDALRILRGIFEKKVARKSRKIDAKATVRAIASTGLQPSFVWKEKAEDKPKVLLLFDYGGSTDKFRSLMLRLLHAAKDLISDVQVLNFHNAVYGQLWRGENGADRRDVCDLRALCALPTDTKVIIVGDASMGWDDTGNGGLLNSYNELERSTPNPRNPDFALTGLESFKKIAAHFPNIVWLNPLTPFERESFPEVKAGDDEKNGTYEGGHVDTMSLIATIFPMYDLSIKQLPSALEELMRTK